MIGLILRCSFFHSEDMVNNSKKLPCGHIFHTSCLRSWFQRQQTCPTCRLNILRAPITADQNVNQPAQVNNQGNNAAPGGAVNNNNANNVAAQNPFMNLLGAPPNAMGGQNNLGTNTAVPLVPGSPLILPPFPFMAPYAVPPPPMPHNLDALTDEELRALEGNERKHVEERIKLLRNILLMMDASVALMNQYTSIASRLPPLPPPVPEAIPSAQPQSNEQASSSDTPSTSTTEATTPSAPPLIEPQPSSSLSSIIPSTSSNAQSAQPSTSSSSSSGTTKKILTDVKLEDIGSEDYVDITHSKKDSTNLGTRLEHIEDPNDPVAELRRRRLQKFLQQEANGHKV